MSKQGCSLFLFLLSLLVGAKASQSPAEKLFQQGNNAYKQQKYRLAINCYDSLRQMGYRSRDLYYNLGNAFYKTKAFPCAILAYERARLLSGYWEPLVYNLSLAKKQITDSTSRQSLPLLKRVGQKTLMYWSAETWAKGTLSLAWLGVLALVFRFLVKNRVFQRLSVLTGMVLMVGFVMALWLTVERYQAVTQKDDAIIIKPSVAVKSAPDAASKNRFVLQGGLKVRLTDQLDSWHQVRLPGGKQGWVRARDIAVIQEG